MCRVEESMLAVHVHIIDKQASIHLIIANMMLDSGGKKNCSTCLESAN